jgi:hypothetical protein
MLLETPALVQLLVRSVVLVRRRWSLMIPVLVLVVLRLMIRVVGCRLMGGFLH